MHVLVTSKYKKGSDQKQLKKAGDIIFPIISQWGLPWIPESICPKTLCSLSFTPMMLHIKFDQDWPTGFRDIQVQKCEILCSWAVNSVVSGAIWPRFEPVRDFMHVLVTCKYKEDQIKSNRKKVETPFSPLYVNGGFLLPWTPEF